MSKPQYKQFIFENYKFDYGSGELSMRYSYDGERKYTEKVHFELPDDRRAINRPVVEALCFYTFIVAGSSYYKSFVAPKMKLNQGLDYWQADFFNMIYEGGLSQFLYENKLGKGALAKFESEGAAESASTDYDGVGVLLMQSGGRDSLLSSELLKKTNNKFTSWHMSTTGSHPDVVDAVGAPVVVSKRKIDLLALKQDWADGGLNGHVPFSAIFAGFALIQSALLDMNLVVASNESSSDESNVVVDGFHINHQFTKTFEVEKRVQEYLSRYVSADMHYGSILRPLNELQIAKLFAKRGWSKYRNMYSSCNLANYKQDSEGKKLNWDGTCPKCANTFLTMAPFVNKQELLALFGGRNLLQADYMADTYQQLLGLSEIKPFECVGTFEELQNAYNLAARQDPDFKSDGIKVTDSKADFQHLGPYQDFFDDFIDYPKLVQRL